MREYLGARGARFAIFPGSGLQRKNPQFLMAGELVETSRLWARQNAAIKPEWAERLGAHLVKRTYSEPHWSKKRAAVMAHERVTLYGVPLVADRLVNYGQIDRELARELFIRHALVYGEWHTRHRFFAKNLELLEEAEELEHRARRRDIVVDEHTLFDFYDARVGAEVVSGAHFDQWWKQARQKQPDLLTFDPEMLTHDTAEEVREADFPEAVAGQRTRRADLPDQLPLRARRRRRRAHHRRAGRHPQPGRRRRLLLERPRPARGAGHRADPQPAQEPAGQLRARAQQGPRVPRRGAAGGRAAARRPRALAARRTTGVVVPRDAWDWTKVPEHLRPTYRVVDDDGRRAGPRQGPRRAEGAAAAAVRRRRWPRSPPTAGWPRTGQTAVDLRHRRGVVHPAPAPATRSAASPALVDEGATVGLQVFGSADEAAPTTGSAYARLLLLALPRRPTCSRLGLDQRRQARARRVAVPLGRRRSSTTAAPPCVRDVVDAGRPVRDRGGVRRAAGRRPAASTTRLRELVAPT